MLLTIVDWQLQESDPEPVEPPPPPPEPSGNGHGDSGDIGPESADDNTDDSGPSSN